MPEILKTKEWEAGYARMETDSGPLRVGYEILRCAQPKGTVALLHGSGPGGSSKGNFSASIAAYAQNFDVLCVDSPGWGRSDSAVVSGSRSHFNAAALKAVLDALGLQGRISLVGCSMGAHSACAFTLRYPQHVQSLVLVSGGSGHGQLHDGGPQPGVKLIQQFYRQPTRENMQAMVECIFWDQRFVTTAGVNARFEAALGNPRHLECFIQSLALNEQPYPDVTAEVSRIECPVLLVWGREDRFVPLSLGQALFAAIPRAEMHVFGYCGHSPQAEHTARFNQLTSSFLLAHVEARQA